MSSIANSRPLLNNVLVIYSVGIYISYESEVPNLKNRIYNWTNATQELGK